MTDVGARGLTCCPAVLPWGYTKCYAPQLPRQFGEGEHIVFAGDIVPKTLELFLKQSTKPGIRAKILA